MTSSVLYMSMSLDGFIAGPDDGPDNPGGDGFGRLHEWISTPAGEYGRPAGPAGELFDEWNRTGAVVAGRRTVEQVDHWGGDNHGGVPIFVPSHRPPGPAVANYPLVTYVADGIESAISQAKAAAGDRGVLVHVRTPRSGRSRPGCWTSCRSIRSRCCSAAAFGCSTCCRRGSSWRSSG